MSLKQHPDLDRALQVAADRRASDAFLFANEPLALRVDGRIESTESPPYSPETLRDIATAALGAERLADLPKTGHAFTSCHLPGVATAQLTAAYANGQLAVTLRVIPSRVPTPEEIALPGVVLDAATRKSGLILFSGPVGSGKTTSAYSVLSHINATQSRLICTVEEPIAYAFPTRRPLILQREVGTDVPDAVTGIVASLRQDADVIFIGELRSLDEVTAGVQAAGLNRLVVTQTHARTAAGAVQRLVDLQPPETVERFRRQLAESLLVSVAQVLLPAAAPGKRWVAAYEVLVPDDRFRQALASTGQATSPAGTPTLVDRVRLLQEQGAITLETADKAIADLSALYVA